jgi:hypothetical protein
MSLKQFNNFYVEIKIFMIEETDPFSNTFLYGHKFIAFSMFTPGRGA